jgi:hypothetical protein
MNENTMTDARLVALFATHPAVDAFYITADGMPFFSVDAANAHAQRQADKNVLEINRNEVDGTEPSSFADGLGEDDEVVAPMHPILADAFNEFRKAEGADEQSGGGVIVPASNILAEPAPVVVTPEPDTPPAPLSLLEIAMATPEGERTSYQKGLITQARNAAIADALKKGETK